MCFCDPNIRTPFCDSKKCKTEKGRIEKIHKTPLDLSQIKFPDPVNDTDKARIQNVQNMIKSMPILIQEMTVIAASRRIQYQSYVNAGFTPEQALHLVKS